MLLVIGHWSLVIGHLSFVLCPLLPHLPHLPKKGGFSQVIGFVPQRYG
ncbi:MAG: hypothetical protein RIG66_13310 [Coleofasciculus sp. E2-BRE-01]